MSSCSSASEIDRDRRPISDRRDGCAGGALVDDAVLELREAKRTGIRSSRSDFANRRLIGEDLSGLDLSGFDLSGADLCNANLTGANLSGANLREAVLVGATLDGAELLRADLKSANMSDCSARQVGLGHANLAQARLFGACLQSATLTSARLEGADLRTANLEGARLRHADLSGADSSRARMRGSDLGNSRVHGACFRNADLREARLRAIDGFKMASWVGADLRHVDFTGAYLLRRHVMDENYLFEFRNQNRYKALLYWLWWLTSDCGRSLVRWFLWSAGVGILFGVLYRFMAIDYGANESAFAPFYFSFVTLTTLGYGDVVPVSTTAQIATIVEVISGYLGLGGLLSILSNKMARRAD